MDKYGKPCLIDHNRDEAGMVGFIHLFGIIFIVLAGVVIANSNIFLLRHVDVLNNKQVSTEEVLLASGLTNRQTIFQVKPQSVTASLLKNPVIEKAEIQIVLPGTVRIKVRERKPLCLISYKKQYGCVASDGVLISYPVDRTSFKLPYISGYYIKPPRLGQKIKAAKIAEVLEMMSFMDNRLRQMITEIDLKHYRLYLRDSRSTVVPVELGNLDKVEQKIENLRAIVSQVNFNEISGINLRVPDIPTVISR